MFQVIWVFRKGIDHAAYSSGVLAYRQIVAFYTIRTRVRRFRQQSFEATQKWFAVVMLAINYLQYRMALAYCKSLSKTSLADFIRQHRLEHFQMLLRSILQPFAPDQQIETCLQDAFSASPWAII